MNFYHFKTTPASKISEHVVNSSLRKVLKVPVQINNLIFMIYLHVIIMDAVCVCVGGGVGVVMVINLVGVTNVS